MTRFVCTILGKPVGWKAPRKGEGNRFYSPAEYTAWKRAAEWSIRAEAHGQKMRTPCRLTLTIYAHHRGLDGGNVKKGVEDVLVLSGVLKDDSLLHLPEAERKFVHVKKGEERVELLLETITDAAPLTLRQKRASVGDNMNIVASTGEFVEDAGGAEGVKKAGVSAKRLTAAVVRTCFPPRRWAVCPNASWGVGWPCEADILAVSKSGRVHEVEVKISASDLKADLKKGKFQRFGDDLRTYAASFWYAVPAELEGKAEAIAKPRGLGLIVVDIRDGMKDDEVSKRISPRNNRATTKEQSLKGQAMRTELWRLAHLRFWDRYFKE
mgnify:CR=1 FL=1